MSKRSVGKSMYQRNEYVYGNTVRQINPVPQRFDKKQLEKPRMSNATRRNRERASHMNPAYVTFLVAAMVFTGAICIHYLNVRAELTKQLKEISALEAELVDLKSDNNETYNRINNSIDLDEIKRIAMEDLGMVYASPEQVVLYDDEDGDYVRQYQDIPKALGK